MFNKISNLTKENTISIIKRSLINFSSYQIKLSSIIYTNMLGNSFEDYTYYCEEYSTHKTDNTNLRTEYINEVIKQINTIIPHGITDIQLKIDDQSKVIVCYYPNYVYSSISPSNNNYIYIFTDELCFKYSGVQAYSNEYRQTPLFPQDNPHSYILAFDEGHISLGFDKSANSILNGFITLKEPELLKNSFPSLELIGFNFIAPLFYAFIKDYPNIICYKDFLDRDCFVLKDEHNKIIDPESLESDFSIFIKNIFPQI